MSLLWKTSLRPIGKSAENDRIQELFIKSVLYINEEMYTYIKVTKKNSITKLIFKNWIWLETKIDLKLITYQYRVYSKSRKKDVTNEV